MSFKLSTTRSITFPNDQARVFFSRQDGTLDVTATDDRITVTIGRDSLFDGVKQFVTGYQYVGSDDAKQAMERLQEISKLAQEAHAKLVENYGVKVVS
jgi:hypothetical protein